MRHLESPEALALDQRTIEIRNILRPMRPYGPQFYALRDELIDLCKQLAALQGEDNREWATRYNARILAAQAAAEAITAEAPALASRASRAAQMAAEHNVTKNGSDHTYDVLSPTDPLQLRTYRVFIGPDAPWTCHIVANPKYPETVGQLCPDIENGAPEVEGRKRCKHMLAAWITEKIGASAPATGTEAPKTLTRPDSTTPPTPRQTATNSKAVAARFADGRPARLVDGTIIRYTAGGKTVQIPPQSW